MDGKNEMIVGCDEGKILLFDADFQLIDDDFLHYRSAFSVPFVFDFDRDGIMDLVVGNAYGRLSYYQGTESGLEWLTDDFGQVDVHDATTSYYGYSVPFAFRDGNETLLAVGSEQGKVFLFNNIDGHLNRSFADISDQWNRFVDGFDNRFGLRSSATLADLNADGKLEMVVGNFAGGLQLFNANIPVSHDVSEYGHETISVFPNPAKTEIQIVLPNNTGADVKIYDLLGRCMKKLTSTLHVDVSDLKSGIYFLEICSDTAAYRGKFVVD